MPDRDEFEAAHLAAWRGWLEVNHPRHTGVWLIHWKKSSGRQVFTWDEAIEEALCFGWIDSKPGKVDAERTRLWFAPRQPGSGWSRLNQERVRRLEAAGRLQPAGAAKVAAARADGSWSRLDAVEELTVPPDLAAALEREPGARTRFEAFPRSARRGILEWILQAKTAPTRARRLAETARLAAQGERANAWRPARNRPPPGPESTRG